MPEAQRVNAQKKRRQLVLLDESIHAIKLGFNERVLALRDLKRRMLDHMHEEEGRLAEINAELGAPPPVPPPTSLEPEEEPERRKLRTADKKKTNIKVRGRFPKTQGFSNTKGFK